MVVSRRQLPSLDGPQSEVGSVVFRALQAVFGAAGYVSCNDVVRIGGGNRDRPLKDKFFGCPAWQHLPGVDVVTLLTAAIVGLSLVSPPMKHGPLDEEELIWDVSGSSKSPLGPVASLCQRQNRSESNSHKFSVPQLESINGASSPVVHSWSNLTVLKFTTAVRFLRPAAHLGSVKNSHFVEHLPQDSSHDQCHGKGLHPFTEKSSTHSVE